MSEKHLGKMIGYRKQCPNCFQVFYTLNNKQECCSKRCSYQLKGKKMRKKHLPRGAIHPLKKDWYVQVYRERLIKQLKKEKQNES